jgi:cytochrome bd-type quinol oxidase subunit 2
LTIANSASAHGSLLAGITWASVGLAIVLIHTTFVYFLFRGKVELESGPVTPPR